MPRIIAGRILPACVVLLLGPLATSHAQPCYEPGAYLPIVANPGAVAGTCDEVEVLQSWAFMLRTDTAPRRLVVWNINDPVLPVAVTSVPLADGASNLRTSGNRLYYTSSENYDTRLHVWDVTDPTTPVERGTVLIDGQPLDLEVDGSLAVLATEATGAVVDVADAAFPTLLSEFRPWEIHGEITHVDLFPGKVVCNVRGEYFGIAVIDILDPTAPTLAARHSLGLWLRGFTMEDDGSHGWAVDSDLILYRVDLEAGGGPVLTRAGVGGSQVTVVDDMVVTLAGWGSDNHVYERDQDGGLALRAVWPQRSLDVVRKGNYLLSAVGASGFHVHQLTPTTVAPYVGVVPAASAYPAARVGTSDSSTWALEMSPDHQRLAVADLSDPDHPRWSAEWPCSDPRVATLRGQDLLLGGDCGVLLQRLSDAGTLSLRTTLRPDDDLYSALWDGDLLWLGSGSSNLWLYDVGDPDAPIMLHEESLVGSLRGLARMGDYLVVARFLAGLSVFDVSVPTAPVEVGFVATTAEVMAVAGEHAYVGSRFEPELKVISLADPTAPTVVDEFGLYDDPRALLADEDRLWVGQRDRLVIYPLAGGLPQRPPLDTIMHVGVGIGGIAPVGDLVAVGSNVLYLMNPPCLPVTAAEAPAVPPALALSVFPNPFNPQTEVSWRMASAGPVDVAVYDLRGRRIRTLVTGAQPAGLMTARWDGRDDAGRALPSGVYAVQVRTSAGVETGKLTLVR